MVTAGTVYFVAVKNNEMRGPKVLVCSFFSFLKMSTKAERTVPNHFA